VWPPAPRVQSTMILPGVGHNKVRISSAKTGRWSPSGVVRM